MEASEILEKEGIGINIISCPSEGLFKTQSKEYRESVLPTGAKAYGLTAGLPVTLESLVGINGHVHGLDSFGQSAPYKVLDRKFGFTPEFVAEDIKKYISGK